ncbi:MAG: hypothetical protein OHK0029_26740 [Armatimonadaceae bacterium]
MSLHRNFTRVLSGIGAVLAMATASQAQLNFNLVDGAELAALQGSNPALYNQVRNGFNEAAALWSNIFDDAVTVNITINYRSLASGILGQASSTDTFFLYSDFRNSLLLDALSADDALATSSLPTGPTFDLLINNTRDNPNGQGSSVPYLDNNGGNNNQIINMTRANAKALGLVAGNSTASDATITFSSNFSFDFDRSNGISGGQTDFVAVAGHEIGHALGFICGCDVLDTNTLPSQNPGAPFNADEFIFVTPLDMFRFSTQSLAFGPGVIDWTADNRTKFFSIDGGATSLAQFATGRNFGDGRQASHWKDNLGIGLMDPTLGGGEFGQITTLDIRAFDVIGWNLRGLSVAAAPEPGTLAFFVVGGIAFGLRLRRRK